MTTTISLGATPLWLELHLSPAADFVQAVLLQDTDGNDVPWATDETLVLRFGTGDAWLATTDGNTASWNVDKAAVAELLARLPRTAQMVYADAATGLDQVWAGGEVVAE